MKAALAAKAGLHAIAGFTRRGSLVTGLAAKHAATDHRGQTPAGPGRGSVQRAAGSHADTV